jgi:uncharacterized membrane protein
MLIPFPIAFFVATFACDIAFLRTGSSDWVIATEWLLGAGLVMAALAAVAGLTDFLSEKKIRNLNAAWWHGGGNIVAVLIALYNFYIRYENGAAMVSSPGVILSALVVLILLFTGWKGWEMVYRHRVGIAEY